MNPEMSKYSAQSSQRELVSVEPSYEASSGVSIDFSEADTVESQTEKSEDIEGAEQIVPETIKEQRLGDLDERLRLLDIEKVSASRDFENWRSLPNTNPADFQYRVPYMKNRLSAAEQAISSTMIDRELVSTGAETSEATNEVVRSFIIKQILEGKVKIQREGLAAIDYEERTLSERLAGYERTIDDFQGIIDGESALVELADDEWSQKYKRDLTEKINRVSDKYEMVLSDKVSRDFGGRRTVLEEEIKAIQEFGVDDSELPRSMAEDPDFSACLSETNFSHSEDDEANKSRTNYDPEKEAVLLFKKRFPHKSAYYERLSEAVEDGEKLTVNVESLDVVGTETELVTEMYSQNAGRAQETETVSLEAAEVVSNIGKESSVEVNEMVPTEMEDNEKNSSERSKEGPPDPASVKEVMKRTGVFFVNTFSAYQMGGALPYLMDTSYDRVVSVSTINPGKNFFGRVSGTYNEDGVILKDGIITSFDKEDSATDKIGNVGLSSNSGMSSIAFSREGRLQKSLDMMDKVAMRRVKYPKKHTSLAYNEFVVRQPQTFGYFESMEPSKNGKIILTHQNLDSFRERFTEASAKSLPVFVLTPDRTFIKILSIKENGELVLGEKLKPEEVYSEEETGT